MRRLTLIVNPTAGAGRAERALPAVRAALSGPGAEVRIERSASAAHATALAREAAERGEIVVAFGGDGMVRLVAHGVRGTGAVMGVLPGGRGNDFVRALGLPRDPVRAARALIEGRPRTVDAGDADGETFVGIASIGLESEVTQLASALPRAAGQASYYAALLAGLVRWRPATFSLELDGGAPLAFTGYLAAASNSGRFGGGMRLAPDARLDDGLLDVVVVEHQPRWRFVARSPRVYRGTHVHDARVHVMSAEAVRMSADRPFEVFADGDPIAATPVLVRAVPGALRILAPAAR